MTVEEWIGLQKDLYCCLSRFYGWSFQTIGEMTPAQMMVALEAISQKTTTDTGEIATDGNLHFSTLEELKFWRESHG